VKKIFYWSPITSQIATKKAVINSANSLLRYSSNYDVTIINVTGEFNKSDFSSENIRIYNLNNKLLKKKFIGKGFFRTRLEMIYIFLNSFFPLIKLLREKKPDYVIIHMLTSLPLIIFSFINNNTKCILRISGLPKLNFLRYFLWKFASKNIHKVTCPTNLTKRYLEKKNLFNNKLITLYDPIILAEDLKKRHNKIKFHNKFFLSAGRLTNQKNFNFLIDGFDKLNLKNTMLYIAGEGEEKNKLNDLIKKKKLDNKIKLLGYRADLFELINKCECFILTSRWEDPGFVLIEAASLRTIIISSDCENGPREIIENEKNGFLFKNNDLNDFVKSFNRYKTTSPKDLYQKKINGLKNAKKFTILSHYNKLNQILN